MKFSNQLHQSSLTPLITPLILVPLALSPSSLFAASSANFTQSSSDFNNGGGISSSATYNSQITIGQPSAVGEGSSATYTNTGGFLAVLKAPIALTAKDQRFSLPLTRNNGDTIGTVTTTEGSATGFSITAGNETGAFSIDNTGIIRVVDRSALRVGAQILTVSLSNAVNTVTSTITLFITDGSNLAQDKDTNSNGINDKLEESFGTADSDADGIPDALEELIGQDVDSTTDTDNDGVPDVAEVLLGRDPLTDDNSAVGAPTLSVTTPLPLLATGVFSSYTLTELGVNALDDTTALTPVAYYQTGSCQSAIPYNYATVCTPVSPAGYVSGTNNVWWLVTDSDGNWARATQTLNILPQISFNRDSVLAGVASAGSVTTQLTLSGPSLVNKTFTVPFTLAGTGSNPADHNAVVGDFTVQAGKTVSEPLTITLGNAPTDGNTIVLSLATNAAVFAQASNPIDITTQFVTTGDKTSQTITIDQGNVYPPRLFAFKGTQGSGATQVQGLLFDRTKGQVTLSFGLIDPDGGNYTYNWSNSDTRLLLADGNTLTTSTNINPVLDLSTLAAGRFFIEVQVTDDSAPNNAPSVLQTLLTLVDDPNLSATTDSDNDGISDAEEGLGDSDGDGQPDYLDAYDNLPNVVLTDKVLPQNYLVKTKPGLRIIIGSTAVAANTGDTKITTTDLASHGDKGQPINDALPTNVALAHIFDYEIENIDVPFDPVAKGRSVSILLPLDKALTADSRFLKYTATQGWQPFTEDSSNSIAWANWQNDVVGNCPENASAYSTDVQQKADKTCLRVTLEDGGANDADGVVNGRIIDPLGVGQAGDTVSISTENRGGGGGSLSLLEILFGFGLGLLQLGRFFRRAKTVKDSSRGQP